MADFKVNFEHLVSVFDPEYASLRLNVTGEASVSSAERSGDDSDIRVVNMMIGDVLMNECMRIVDSGTSFKDLGSKSDVISQAVAGALAGKNITLNSFTITGITPDALSQQGIELRDKMNAAKSMTPADYAKRIEEAQKKAQEQLEKMTPEERQKAQEDAKKAYEAKLAEIQSVQDQVNAMKAAATAGAVAGAAAFEPQKRFCPNCGAPRGLGKFCPSCGSPLT